MRRAVCSICSKMPSLRCTTLVLFIWCFAKYSSGWHNETHPHHTYELKEPVRLAVETDEGMITSYLYPGQRLRTENPNNNFICHQLQRNQHTAFLVPPRQHQDFMRTMLSYLDDDSYPYSHKFSRYLSSLGSDGKPWVIFLKSNSLQIPSNAFERAHLRSIGGRNIWEMDVLTMNSPEEKDDQVDVDYPDDTLSAPPPSYQSLCVGPEFPKPYPVLYSFPPNTALRPSLSYFNIADITPVAID